MRAEQEATHAEALVHAQRTFQECVELIDELRENEIVLKSGDEVTSSMIGDAQQARQNIRVNRLARYEEMAKKDEEFQTITTGVMQAMLQSYSSNQDNIKSLVALLTRLVDQKLDA